MELIKPSKFKLQLQTLIMEVRELREKERASSDQLHNHVQKQKQSDEEYSRKITELEAELASSNELRQKLERKVQFLEDENYLLESKHKELKETISSILQAKEGFVKAYQESTSEMRRSIESRDKKIAILSEKINAHLSSFDTIRKEASFVKQVVDNAERVVNEKEEVVSQLKIKLDKVCAFENLFIEKIKDLETKLRNKQNECIRKDRVITELQTAKITVQCQPEIEELKETLEMKEGIIETLISENKALHSEVGMLVVTVKTIQDTMTRMDEEDRVAFPLMPLNQEKNATDKSVATAAEIRASPSCKEYAPITSPLIEDKKVNSCVSESTFSPRSSFHAGSQPATNNPNMLGVHEKDNGSSLVGQLDSECSTTQGGTC